MKSMRRTENEVATLYSPNFIRVPVPSILDDSV